jgi:hypothetical protein
MSSRTRYSGFASLTPIDTPASSKIHIDPRLEARGLREDTPLLVIIRVNPGWKAPTCVSVREQISPRILTAQVALSALKRLEGDPDVLSVSSSRPLSVG